MKSFILFIAAPLLAAPIVSVAPRTTPVNVGSSFFVDVRIEGVTDLYGYQLDIGFDPAILAVQGLTEGDFLADGGSTFWIEGALDSDAGLLAGTSSILIGAVPGVSGKGTLFSIRMRALAEGSSNLTASSAILLGSDLSGIEATIANGRVTVVKSEVPGEVPEGNSGALAILGFAMALATKWRRTHRSTA